MALTGSKRDWLSAYPGTMEFDWFWGTISGVFEGDQYGTGPIPMPRPPPVISEIPDTWEEYEAQYPEYFEPILETRPGRTPDPYPQPVALPSPEQLPAEPDEEEPVAHDWGHLARQFIGDVSGSVFGDTSAAPAAGYAPAQTMAQTSAWLAQGGGAKAADGCDGMAWSGGTPPKGYKVVNYCGQGVLRKIRRRRRRRILSASDAADIATIVGLVGKGQMASALINRRG